jgi:hypothetical protein
MMNMATAIVEFSDEVKTWGGCGEGRGTRREAVSIDACAMPTVVLFSKVA